MRRPQNIPNAPRPLASGPMPESSSTAPIEDDAARLLKEVIRRQKFLAVLHAPLFRAPAQRAPGLPKPMRLLFLFFLLPGAVGTMVENLEHAVFLLGTFGVLLVVALYLDVRCRQDALVALLEDSDVIGPAKSPAE